MANLKFESEADNPDFPGVTDITPAEVNEKREEITIVDVRRPDEFEGEFGHIPGAQHIVLDTLPTKISDLSKNNSIVFICRSGRRSAQAVTFAKENGFDSVYNMAGGMIAWDENGFEAEGKS